ncbi:MAG: ATP-binding protein [Roseicyclus sp.]
MSSIFRLDTAFGGGKTHGLIALVHAARGMSGVSNIAEFVDPTLVPTRRVRVAAFDGERSDPANGRPMGDGIRAYTPWGEIAHQLGGASGYEILRRSDEERIAPGVDTIAELFGEDPVLVVLDELGEYLRKSKTLGGRDQLPAFLKALFTAIDRSPNAAVVYTLALRPDGTAVDAFTAENEYLARQMDELESVSGRKATNLNPTRDEETALVLKRRLFKSVDEVGARSVVEAYRRLWSDHREALSEEGRRTSAEEFLHAYPFHPDLLRTLTGKTATLADFQRVRGMLRILGQTVAALWSDRPRDATAIHVHHLDLGREGIKREFTTRLRQTAFDPALMNDIVGSTDKQGLARDIDARHFKGLAPYASYVARTIFVHTMAYNNELKGIAPDHLRYSILGPSLDITFIDDARAKFVTDSAYLDDRPTAPLRFTSDANLTQLIGREERRIEKGEVRAELNDRIKSIFRGNAFEMIAFPAAPYDVPDDVGEGKPRLAVVGHDALAVGSDISTVPELVGRMFERTGAEGAGLRKLRNNVVFLLADENTVANMQHAVARRLALRELKRPDRLNELADHQRARVLELESKAETEAAVAIQNCYRHLLYPSPRSLEGPGTTPLAHSAIDVQNASEKPGSGQLQVLRQLKAQRKLYDEHDEPESPAYIRDRTPLKQGQITPRALRDEFRRDPSLSIHLSDDLLRNAIWRGVEEGTFVYRRGDLLAGPGDPRPSINIDEDSVVFTMAYAKEKGIWPRPAPPPDPKPDTGSEEGGGGGENGDGSGGDGGGGGHRGAGGGGGTDPGTDGDGGAAPPNTFTAEGVLKAALDEVFEKARSAHKSALKRVTIRLFEYGDGFKLAAIAQTVPGCSKTVGMDGSFTTVDGSSMEFAFGGTAKDAATMKEYLEPQFRAAQETQLTTSLTFAFEPPLSLAGTAAQGFADRLTRYAAAAAFVEAEAEAA